jgi:hypothetical protein
VSYVVLTSREREELIDLFFKLKKKGEQNLAARTEALTALRCLKAVPSHATPKLPGNSKARRNASRGRSEGGGPGGAVPFASARDAPSHLRQDPARRGGPVRLPHHSRVPEILYSELGRINGQLFKIDAINRSRFLDVLRLSV